MLSLTVAGRDHQAVISVSILMEQRLSSDAEKSGAGVNT